MPPAPSDRNQDVLGEVEESEYEDTVALESIYGDTAVVEGRRGTGSVGGVDTAGDEPAEGSDVSRAFIREEVAPQYRKLVEEYYRSLAERKE